MPDSDARFPSTTRLSLVLRAAGEGSSEDAAHAMNDLCSLYWEPVYACARRKGLPPADAEDCVQEVLAHVATHPIPESCLTGEMKLRVYLVRQVMNVLSDWHERAGRQKRGGGVKPLPLDAEMAERHYLAAPDRGAPGIVFDYRWARCTLDRSLEVLRVEEENASRPDAFEVLRPFLDSSGKGEADYAAASAQLQQAEATTRQQVHRLRQRCKAVLKAEVARTLAAEQGGEPSDAMVLDEMRALLAALRRE